MSVPCLNSHTLEEDVDASFDKFCLFQIYYYLIMAYVGIEKQKFNELRTSI